MKRGCLLSHAIKIGQMMIALQIHADDEHYFVNADPLKNSVCMGILLTRQDTLVMTARSTLKIILTQIFMKKLCLKRKMLTAMRHGLLRCTAEIL